MEVIKRDGRVAPYDRFKIVTAIQKANAEVEPFEQISEDKIYTIVASIENRGQDKMQVEDIQDIIEQKLMAEKKFVLAKTYIIYRYTRELVRKANTTDDSILSLIKNSNKDVMEENSNKNPIIASTQRDLIAGEVSKDLTKRMLLPEKISKAHELGILHFHDADYFLQPIFNCCLINIGDMLENGTVMNGKLIESPKSFQVACTVMTQIISAVASSQYGGQSVDIKHLGKYLRKSREKYTKHYLEEFGSEMNPQLIDKFVRYRLEDELRSGVQTIQYHL
jgi:anaerobic ribonucleoside-triphosphate reductase